jgi:hypothetical protein
MVMNNLDAVWASLTSADRIVLLGHDRDFLTDGEKARLAAVAADKADRRATVRSAPRGQVRGRSGAQNRSRGRGGRAQRGRRAA